MLVVNEPGLAALKENDGTQTVLNAVGSSDVNGNEILLNDYRVLNCLSESRRIIEDKNGVRLLLELMRRCASHLGVDEQDEEESGELQFL